MLLGQTVKDAKGRLVLVLSDIHQRNGQDMDHVALSYHEDTITYAELEDKIEHYARFLVSRGLAQGDRVAVALPNCPEFIYAYLGTVRAGGVVLPLNLLQSPQELLYMLRDSGARLLVTNPTIAQGQKLPLDPVILDDTTKRVIESAGAVCFPEGKSDSVASFLYTSGTTGQPKAAMLTHANLLGNVRSMDDASDFGRDDNFLAVLPMFHAFGWTVCVLLPLFLGCTITILDGFRPKETQHVLSEQGITVFCGVPSMFTVLLKVRHEGSFPQLKFAISGGDSISEEVLVSFEKKFNFPIIEGYGLSEASPVVCLNPLDGVRKTRSIGIPLPGVTVRVVDDADLELPAGEIGELVVRGPNVMAGYFGREEETREILRGGWLHTGDLAYRDEDGYLFIAGRKKELIITSGFNVYPREVEEALASHPAVLQAAVIGVPHPVKGEVVKAFVIPEEGCHPNKQELFRYLKERLAGYKIPEEYVITADLPRGFAGKVVKRLLK